MGVDEKRERWSDKELESFHQEFREHVERFERHMQDEAALMSSFLKAYPNDDPVAHRQYHEAVMRAAEEQEKFWRELRIDIAKKSIWGIITLLVGLVLAGAAVKLGARP